MSEGKDTPQLVIPPQTLRQKCPQDQGGHPRLRHGASLLCRLGISDLALDFPESGMVTA